MANRQDKIDFLKAQVAALTKRVYHLERMSGLAVDPSCDASHDAIRDLKPTSAPPVEAGPQSPPRVSPPPLRQARPSVASALTNDGGNLEKKIGQYWLNRIGIVAILIGVSYFLKYAFENDWIGPGGRVAVGLLAGIGMVLWSERFRGRGHAAFSYSLKAVGIGTLYLSLWGAFQIYHLIPSAVAFSAMAIVTAATIALALSQDAELLASFSLVGGFATPVLLSSGQNHEVALFAYVCLLNIAILAMAVVKPWRRLLWGSFMGTVTLYLGWYSTYYSIDQRTTTVVFAALLAAIFAAIPLAAHNKPSTRIAGPSITLTLLPLLNAVAFFLALFAMYQDETTTLTWFALALAGVYLGIGGAFKKRFPDQDTKFINLLHVAIAIAFITIAIPLKLDAQWITIGWLIESAVLLWIGVSMQAEFLRYFAIAALILGIYRLLIFDRFHADTLLFNARFGTYAVAIAVLGGIAGFGRRYASGKERPLLNLAVVALNSLALIALTLEASDYFDRQAVASMHYSFSSYRLSPARAFSYSAIWLVYGAVLMTIGFRKRSAFLRWQSLILIAFTIFKVFLYDLSQLGGSYRIFSFIALGAVLLGISFIYQRDWLKLSRRSSEKSAGGTG